MHAQTMRSLVNARDFMRASYGNQLTLPEVSAHANLSPYHFLRVHREAFQETPHQFLTRLRIEHARSLLSKGSHSVTEACFEVGYSSVGSFSGLFVRHVGISPSEYRKYARARILVPRNIRTVFVPSCFLSMICK